MGRVIPRANEDACHPPGQPVEQRMPRRPAACMPVIVNTCAPPDNCPGGHVCQGGTNVEVGGNIWLRWQQRQRQGRGEMHQREKILWKAFFFT
jgi:hypothetical protein